MSPFIYDVLLKTALLTVIISSILVILHAVVTAKALGGTLGQSLKKIAIGISIHIILFATYSLLERGNRGILTDDQIRLFLMCSGTIGSIFLILGFFQLYHIAKKLKLFTI